MEKWVKRRLLSFKYAFKGVFYVIRTQTNMRIHLILTLVALFLGWFLKINKIEWLFITLAIFAVLVSEMINTAIEEIMDLLYPKFNTKVGIIKDIAAGVVLLFAVFAIIIGVIIFLPKIINLL